MQVERSDTKSNAKLDGFRSRLQGPTCLAALKSSDRTKQCICGWQYILSTMGVEHSGEGIFGRRSHNAKLFERIEHSGSRQGIKI